MEDISLPYSLLPLNQLQREIRLLRLHPGHQHNRLRAELRVVSLHNPPSYEALSYTWGKSTSDPQPVIYINDNVSLPLTDNLHNALKRLRRRFRTRVLWIDALCINQEDLAERASQVSFMGETYKSARGVCVWLGDTSDISLSNQIHVSITPLWLLASTHRILRPVWTFGAAVFISALAKALAEAAPPWHTRLWVFQELNHARKVLWCFGPCAKSATPQIFAEACRGARKCSQYGEPDLNLIDRFAGGLESISKQVWWDDKQENVDGIPSNLLRNAILAQDLMSSDPRDKVFALQSMSQVKESSLIEINYKRPATQVYAEATYASIAGSGSFDIFRHVELDGPRLEGLPSWAADFAQIPWISWAFSNEWTMITPDPHNLDQLLPNPRIDKLGKSLSVNAILLDDVSQSAAILSCQHERNRQSNMQEKYDYVSIPSVKVLKDILQDLSQMYRNEMSGNLERIAYTAYSHHVGTRRVVASDWEEARSVLDRAFVNTFDDEESTIYDPLYPLLSSVRWWTSYIGPTPIHQDLDPKHRRSSMQMRGFLAYLRGISVQKGAMFTTVAGFLGFAAVDAQPGDIVAIVHGCWLPILIRS